MNDIYDIKDTLLGFPIDIINTIVFIVFIIASLFILKLLLKKQEKITIKQEIKVEKIEKNYIEILNQFEKVYLDSNKDIFYSKLIEITREILENKQNKNITKMTYTEINKLNLNTDIKSLIKEIYFKEYKKYITDDNPIYRKQLIDNVRKLMNNE
ncbi:MAG: hypothetical protein PHS49_03485 [Candidatus Gracilibacteria bacterium]|nr:hypothetical protein [Candidatus Gracilibacteria bacterium]